MGAPSAVSVKQLRELSLRLAAEGKATADAASGAEKVDTGVAGGSG